MSHLWEVFHGVAIPGEGISFRFIDPRGAFAYESRESALDRAKRHAGDDGQYLVPVDVSSAFFRIFGWAGLPQVSRAGAGGLWFFVNGRRFRDRGLYAAVREAYRGILPGDRLPVLYLFVTCSPGEVDVNVHPAKTEVRFRYPRDLNELARHAIGGALGEAPSRAAFPFHAWEERTPPGGLRPAGSPPDMSLEGVTGSPFPLPAAGAERVGDCRSPNGAARRPGSGSFPPLSRSGRCWGRIWSARMRTGSSSSTSTPPTSGSSSRA